MNCHIQLNQGWMKYFKNDRKDGKQTYCLSLPDLNITSEKIGELGASNDYYVNDIENFYDKNYEKPFGEILNKITKGIKSTSKNFVISNDEKLFIQRFIAINISRNPTANVLADLKSSLPLKFLTPQGVLSLAVHTEQYKYFDGCKIRFIYNCSSIGFVLPSFCHYRISENTAVIPVSDKIAIIFDNSDCAEYSVLNISDESIINNQYNYWALFVEVHTNCQFVISKTEQPLIEIKNILLSTKS